jgi:LmbE family N-acetylglucosaminyl deacetylase
MNKIIFGIFAHPDDEAFGPSGALLKAVHEGAELHLITLTDGGGGMNPDNVADLGKTRLAEWHKAGGLFGAKSMHYLGYEDGQLNNLAMIEASRKLTTIITEVLKEAPVDAPVEFMTLDLNGLTGHIDHIVAARAACFVFYTLKKEDPRFTRILFSCLTAEKYPLPDTSWIFREKGRTIDEIDEIVDAREFQSEITAIAKTHVSQRHDAEYFFKTADKDLGMNYFIIKN